MDRRPKRRAAAVRRAGRARAASGAGREVETWRVGLGEGERNEGGCFVSFSARRGRLSPPLPQQHTTDGHIAWTADGFPPTAALAYRMPLSPHVYAMHGGKKTYTRKITCLPPPVSFSEAFPGSFRASLVQVTPSSRFDLSPKSAARPQQSATSLFRAPPGDLVSEKSDMRVTRSYVHTRPEKEIHLALFSATTLIPAFGREPT